QQHHDADIEREHEPQPLPQEPQRREQERPQIEAVADEAEALRVRLGGLRRRFMDSVDGHASSENSHPPSRPLVDGTSPAARGSMASAARNTRARPLKQDSEI